MASIPLLGKAGNLRGFFDDLRLVYRLCGAGSPTHNVGGRGFRLVFQLQSCGHADGSQLLGDVGGYEGRENYLRWAVCGGADVDVGDGRGGDGNELRFPDLIFAKALAGPVEVCSAHHSVYVGWWACGGEFLPGSYVEGRQGLDCGGWRDHCYAR